MGEVLDSDECIQETFARYRAMEPSNGSNVIPKRARPGLAGLGPQRGTPVRSGEA